METAGEDPSRRRKPGSGAAHSARLGFLAVAAAAVLWALAATVARSLFEDGVSPLELSQARAYLAFGGFALLRRWRREPRRRRVRTRPPTIRLVALGASIALVNAAYYIAIEHLAVAVAIVIQYTAPALVVGWIAARTRVRPPPDVLLAVVLAIVGVALAAGIGSGELRTTSMVGLVAAGASALLFAMYTLLSQDAAGSYGPTGAMFRAFGVAAAIWLVFQAPQGLPAQLLEPANLLRVAYVGLAGTLAPFLLYVWGVERVRAERAVIAATLEPPAAALVAWMWLGQALGATQIVGGILVLAAVLLLQARPHPLLEPPAEPAGYV